jgi:hypothetical protein
VLVALVLSVSTASPAVAGFRRGVATNRTGDRVKLTFVRRGDGLAVEAPHAARAGRRRACEYRLQPIDLTRVQDDSAIPPAPNAESEPYFLFCGGEYRGVVWIGPHNTVDPAASARAIADRLVREVRVPSVSVGINPREGLTGLESWFWIRGYDGRPINRRLTAFGLTVEVRIRRGQVTWDFGDGTPPTAGDLGRAYPARSTVRHVYTVRSAARPYTVTAQFDLAPEFRVDGGAWQPLPPIVRTATSAYTVREVQAVID